ncbi:hypothetical protein GHT06_011054 [Daphnia sinensis]|uniref:Uncharacterized protein n=1 Tax=Daphnia sinensis TaxID=1820382 RepID=A0AAD5LIY2_9CRUS|nr:hypothetical protein GHT06_011054 [Daphnia sinensis]
MMRRMNHVDQREADGRGELRLLCTIFPSFRQVDTFWCNPFWTFCVDDDSH